MILNNTKNLYLCGNINNIIKIARVIRSSNKRFMLCPYSMIEYHYNFVQR